jgi:hypothetical protein
MKELRVQHEGRPLRILFAFDPRRAGLLLIGGDKTGHNRWYEEFVPKADAIYTHIFASWSANEPKGQNRWRANGRN